MKTINMYDAHVVHLIADGGLNDVTTHVQGMYHKEMTKACSSQ